MMQLSEDSSSPLHQVKPPSSPKVRDLKEKWSEKFRALLRTCPRYDYDRWLARFEQFKEMWDEPGFEEKLLNDSDLVHQTDEDFSKMYFSHDPVEITSIVDKMLKRLSRNYRIPSPCF